MLLVVMLCLAHKITDTLEEHPFHVVKNLFHHKKVRYKGLAKNAAQLFSLFALANLVIAKRRLLAIHAAGSS